MGSTFKINEEYTIVMTVVIGDAKEGTSLKVESYKKGSDVLHGSYAATGWDQAGAINVSYFQFEYRGVGYVGAYTNTQTFKSAVVEKILPYDINITVRDDLDDVNGMAETKNEYTKDETYDVNKVDVAGTKFIIETDYTYKGIGGVFEIDPETFAVTSKFTGGDFAYMGFYTKNSEDNFGT